ncbi:hypothetical protein [Janibacter alkaliphilus]|uniref:Uncharacterized protein n=1 Tax=Janibacter alkaliphilus TaxID=1069963 RepID=A0A852XBZ1_9MICO|nr:hypothetical protein [Janibacter alkaliphilus]NYG37954.1 hypothetical protein [Janibacter alkaliphilus]
MTPPLSTQHSPLRRTTLRATATASLAALALTGCSMGSSDEEEQSPTETQTESTETPSETPSETPTETSTTSETSEESGQSSSAAAPASGDVAEPGTEVSVGDSVVTHVQTSGEKSDEYFGYATLSTTVTSAEQGDPALFEEAENSGDFAGMTPWFVKAEHEWLTYEGEPNGNMIPNLVAFNSEGGEVSPVMNSTWSGGIDGCDISMPDEKGVGEKATNCHVFAVPDGQQVAAVGWRGDDYADGGGSASDNPYYDDPVVWTVD